MRYREGAWLCGHLLEAHSELEPGSVCPKPVFRVCLVWNFYSKIIL